MKSRTETTYNLAHVNLRVAAIPVAILLLGLHFACFEIRTTPIIWDTRFYLFFASQVAHGAVPYRDFFEIKTPLSIFAGAALFDIGQMLGIEPLLTIRVGYLLFSAIIGLLLFATIRRLVPGRLVAGFLVLLAYCAFALLGWLPSLGVLPKLLMALFAMTSALFVMQRRYVLAGAAGTLAFLDWQIGGLAVLAAAAGAFAAERQRLRSAGSVVLGAIATGLPFVLYFLSKGALGLAFDQTIALLFARGAGSAEQSMFQKLTHLVEVVNISCNGQQWLFYAGFVGMPVYLLWLWRWRHCPRRFGFALTLGVYHYGMVAFSLFDFQSHGDLLVLLHAVVFFATVVLVEVTRRLLLLVRGHRTAIQIVVILLMVLLTRPAFWRSDYSIHNAMVESGTTLADQKEVARRIQKLKPGWRKAVIGPAELLFFNETPNSVPFVYWNNMTWLYYRSSPEESYLRTLKRLLEDHKVDLIIFDRRLKWERKADRVETSIGRVVGKSGGYSVMLRRIH